MDKEIRKPKTFVLSDTHLDMLFDCVLIKRFYFNKIRYSIDIWDRCIPYLEELVNADEPDIYISTIKNKLRSLDQVVVYNSRINKIRVADIITIQLYVILYYRYRDDETYKYVLKSLEEILGLFAHRDFSDFNKTREYLAALPQYKGPNNTTKPTNEVDAQRIMELEKTILDLRSEVKTLTEENIELRKQIESYKDLQTTDLEERVIVDRGQGNKIKHHMMTAKESCKIVQEDMESFLNLPKNQWESIISKLTGLSESSIHRYMS